MNRVIKFRVWDKIDNVMREYLPELLFGEKAIAIAVNDEDGGHMEKRLFEDIELMQFTGLTDKNGKEIYEGDIVKVGENVFQIAWYAMSAAFDLFTIAPATNSTGTYMASAGVPLRDWNWLDMGKAVNFHGMRGKAPSCEVIGNVFEKPELPNPPTATPPTLPAQ